MAQPDTKQPDKSSDAGQSEVQSKVAKANEQGFYGSETDPTPNEHYTFGGQAANKPTPETHPEHAAKVAAELRNRA